MTSLRFAAMVGLGANLDRRHRARALARANGLGLNLQKWGANGVLALDRSRPRQGEPALIGRVLRRGATIPAARGPAARDFARLGPEAFAASYWGDYLAFAAQPCPGTALVARAPFGATPCFWAMCGPLLCMASAPDLLAAFCGRYFAVDWEEIACFLLATEMRRDTTCLAGVSELEGGSALWLEAGQPRPRPFWTPWRFTGRAGRLTEPQAAAACVREAVDGAIAGGSEATAHAVLLLSGGIDSSVVAASLAAAGRPFTALTMVTRERSGDERAYARAVAAMTGAPLVERLRTPGGINWNDAALARYARPSARLFRQPTLAAACELAGERHAAVVYDGGGGDNLFCSLQSVAPLLDRIALEGAGRGAWTTAREIARFADVGVLAVARKAAARLASRRVAYRWTVERSFLTQSAQELAGRATRHPWLTPPPGTLAGSAAHVALILGALALAEDDSTDACVETRSLLVAQPVVEAALRVPSWMWFEDGRNRAVVRHAFAGRLPRAVLERHGKGTPAGFIAELTQVFRPLLRTMLCDGLLAAQGVIDPDPVRRYLGAPDRPRDVRFARIMQLADAERWARAWQGGVAAIRPEA